MTIAATKLKLFFLVSFLVSASIDLCGAFIIICSGCLLHFGSHLLYCLVSFKCVDLQEVVRVSGVVMASILSL